MSNLYLITGGAGFIGANLCRQLLKTGAKVRVLDDFSTGRWENLAGIQNEIEVCEGDVRDVRALKRAATGSRGIFHLAALPGALPGQDETRMLDVNVKGTLCALIVARDLHLPMVFTSSAAVYGARDAYLLHEKMPPEPRTPLGAQKLAAETYCRLFFESHNVRTVVLRLFNAFGPYESGQSIHASVVARFAHALARGKAPVVFGDGSQTRDFIYVDNVCDALAKAARAIDAAGGVFNIGSGDAIAINLLYNQMAEIAGFKKAPQRGPARPSDLRHIRAALGHSTAALKWAPQVRLREGLERTLAWHRDDAKRAHSKDWFAPASDEVIELDDDIPIYEAEEVIA